jgi:hypothetical protein
MFSNHVIFSGYINKNETIKKDENLIVVTDANGNIFKISDIQDEKYGVNLFRINNFNSQTNKTHKNYKIELSLNRSKAVQLIQISYDLGGDNVTQSHKITKLNVSPYRICKNIQIDSYPPKYPKRNDFFEEWFVCEPQDFKAFKEELTDMSKKISFAIESEFSFSIYNVEIYFVEQFTRNKRPICGKPDIPPGVSVQPIEDQYSYEMSCNKGFLQLNSNSNKSNEITCDYNMKWKGIMPQCYPSKFCPKFEIGQNNFVKVHSYQNVYYQNYSKWYAIEGTEALIECGQNGTKPYNLSVVCDRNMQWRSNCSDIRTNTRKCISKKGYNGIDNWPSVEAGKSSPMPCPQGEGQAYWKCNDDGNFDEDGPNWSECDKWVNDLPDIFKSLDEALEVSKTISNKTDKNNVIISNIILNRLLEKVEILQEFIESKTELNFDNAKNYAQKSIGSFSNVINQKYAWINSTVEQKINMSSKILTFIQKSSFTLVLRQNSSNKVESIKNVSNIYLKTFFTNFSEELVFPSKKTSTSSISVPKGIEIKDKSDNQNNTAAGAIINKLKDYLMGGITENKKINSEILSFSLRKGTNSIELNKEVKIRYVFYDFLRFEFLSQ